MTSLEDVIRSGTDPAMGAIGQRFPFRNAGRLVYGFVASNRYSLSKCRGGACRVAKPLPPLAFKTSWHQAVKFSEEQNPGAGKRERAKHLRSRFLAADLFALPTGRRMLRGGLWETAIFYGRFAVKSLEWK